MPESGARWQKFRFSSVRGNRAIRRGSSLNSKVGFLTREALNDELVGNQFAGNRESSPDVGESRRCQHDRYSH
jgi:hypothetical protein